MEIVTKSKLVGNIAKGVNPLGCQKEIENQIQLVKDRGTYEGPKKVLVLGASSSYGLASRISTAFGSQADTIGVSFERGPVDENNIGTAGWYNCAYFKQYAQAAGLIAKNFIGDAFSKKMKDEVITYIKEEFGGKVDLVVYSIASPKRIHPDTGIVYTSAIKPIGQAVEGQNINLEKEILFDQKIDPATQSEIEGTIEVMGGEDWEMWIDELLENDCLTDDFKTVLYSYIGPECTHEFYHKGTLGLAKKDAEKAQKRMNKKLQRENKGEALISVSKVVTTKASAVIPILPLYCIALYKLMVEQGTHETSIMHKDRLLREMIYGDKPEYDELGRLRPDNWELDPKLQKEVTELMEKINAENFTTELTAYDLFRKEFMNLNGFSVDGVSDENELELESLMELTI
ncbi:enoyl-ACP reductase FabV [Enterococcus sp. AZ109]|uniref:enoyl-ACP reductase FabV n=1 Tax=Enterococcus sp. AZ109 TaxID=2774634 RepID=UPI003F28FFEC